MQMYAQKPLATQPVMPAKSKISTPVQFGQSREAGSIRPLRRTIGIQVGQEMTETHAEETITEANVVASSRLGHDFSRIPVHYFPTGSFQAKLAINHSGGKYEQEADQIAERVIRIPEPQLQRNCNYGGTCADCQKARLGPEDKRLQLKLIGANRSGQISAPPIVHEVLCSPGQPLDLTTRTFMEQRFGYDFSRVRVHFNTAAEQSARKLDARAYTIGHDIVFGPGQFAPTTEQGRRLLAHELTHVVQQSQVDEHEVTIQRKGEFSGLPPIVFGLLNGMDSQGETILGTYLYGGGKRHDIEDPIWSAYMMEHRSLRLQILARLIPVVREIAARGQKGRYPIAETFHAEFPENSGFSGYALLHGTNKKVGDFQLLGWADVEDAVDPAKGDWDIELDLRFVFNDIVDPNSNYWSDILRNLAAEFVTFGQAKSYELSIHWSSSCLAEVRGQRIELSGYPAEHPIGIRPLPRGKLERVRREKEQEQ